MILTIFKKDLKLFFSDKRAVLLTFLMPILLISLFAVAVIFIIDYFMIAIVGVIASIFNASETFFENILFTLIRNGYL